MTLQGRLTLLAAAIREKINLMVPRLLPEGGTANQVLAKSSNLDNAVAWIDPPSSGSGLTQAQVLARGLGC